MRACVRACVRARGCVLHFSSSLVSTSLIFPNNADTSSRREQGSGWKPGEPTIDGRYMLSVGEGAQWVTGDYDSKAETFTNLSTQVSKSMSLASGRTHSVDKRGWFTGAGPPC